MRYFLMSGVLVALLSVSHLGHAHGEHHSGQHDEQVELAMKKIQRAYRTALRSDTLEQLKPAVAQLIEVTRQASTLHYGINPTEHNDYQAGMRQLRTDLERVRTALAANDLTQAKQILSVQIKTTRDQAHDKLGVKQD